MHWSRTRAAAIAATVTIVAGAFGTVVLANHSWGTYHWARTTSSFTLTIVNSTTDDWDPYVAQSVGDWSISGRLNVVESTGATGDKDRRQCRGPDGAVRICNLAYGQTGWLGIAGISIDPGGHIFTGYTKLNDTYFSMSYYNNDSWKQSVTCQELGHNVGLDHQDENFNNVSLESCMDYQDPPWPFPNGHDYDQLEVIYGGHTDSYNSYAGGDTGGGGGGGACNAPPGKGCNKAGTGQGQGQAPGQDSAAAAQDHGASGWGISLGRRGAHEKFLRIEPDGTRHVTFVTWVAGY